MIILLLVAGLFFWYASGQIMFNFLSINKPLKKADILLLEGWINDNEVKEAMKLYYDSSYRYIVTTGVNTSKYYMMGMDGDLVVNTKNLNINKGKHFIDINAYSSLANGVSGQFELYANNKKIGETFTTQNPENYNFSFTTDYSVDSIMIRFMNDALYNDEDINLYVSTVSVDKRTISVNDTLNYYTTIVNKNWKNYLAKNHAIRIKKVLKQYGLPDDKVIAISTPSYNESRTAETAKNTIRVLDSLFKSDTLRINIFSRYPHTRRTYNAYKKYAENKMQIGILSSSEHISRKEKGRMRNMKELVGILFLKISLK